MSGPWNPADLPPPTEQVPVIPGPSDEWTVAGSVPPVPPQPLPPPPFPGGSGNLPPPPSSPRRGWSPTVIAAIVMAVVVALGAIGVTAFALGRRGSGDDEIRATDTIATTSSSSTVTTTTATTTSAAPPPDGQGVTGGPITTMLGDVRGQPAGLFCRDLRAQGYSYTAAVDYWRAHGQPDQMDADRNGIPCETVYPRSDVTSYWGPLGRTPTWQTNSVYDLGPGLLCRDLLARGFGVYDAIAYYLNWDRPADMDADHNGIPCETVYPDAAAAWFGGGD